ncbi:hypothetical protein ACFL6O_05175 [candidate division KSB1 bacterium]
MSSSEKNDVEYIASIIHNYPLTKAICTSIRTALNSQAYYVNGSTITDVFKASLDASIRDIENHQRGELFRRLIEYGPPHPDDPELLKSDGETILSDPELGACVQFIYSFMINRFKGELAELLSIEPCSILLDKLKKDGQLPENACIYFGDLIQERRRLKDKKNSNNIHWGSFTKGADGLIVERQSSKNGNNQILKILGIIEVKSMVISTNRILRQIDKHLVRLQGGVKLGDTVWAPNQIDCSDVLRILIVPSKWKLSREWKSVETSKGRKLLMPEPEIPTIQTQIEKLQHKTWRIKLAWSQESLNEAAYEMTFWYMSQVGKHIYTTKSLPEEWKDMTPEEAGYNAAKMMLYYIPLRYLSERQERLGIRLYNVYSFGYPLGADSKEMLWPEDFKNDNADRV